MIGSATKRARFESWARSQVVGMEPAMRIVIEAVCGEVGNGGAEAEAEARDPGAGEAPS